MKKHLFKFILMAVVLLPGVNRSYAQCNFTGLNPNYCTNSAPSTLVPGIPGGTFTGPGITNNVFNPSVAGPGTHTINYSTCSSTYAVTQITYAATSTVGTVVSLTDDSESGALSIGFTFKFFCVPYNNFYISSNGFIEFGLGGSGCCAGQFMPGSNPNNLIAAAWTDLNPGTGGTITYSTTGSAPNRTLTVSYVGVSYFNTVNNGPVTTQIRIAETSNIIEVHSASIPGASGYNTTMGITNAGGGLGFPAPGRNASATWTASFDGFRWTPGVTCNVSQVTTVSPSTITVVGNNSICIGATASLTAGGNTTYTWSTSSNASSITPTPTINTTYTVSGTNQFGCVANTVITVTVDNTPTVTAVSSNSTNGSCPSSSLALNGAGATAYVWTGGITNAVPFFPTTSTTYTVTGSNACGSNTAVITTSIHPLPPVTGSINNPTICSGSSVILNGGGAVTYTWSSFFGQVPNNTAFAPSATTNYTVRGTSALGCTATAVVGSTVLITPTITPVANPTVICFGQTSTLSAVGATGYTWTPGTALNSFSTVVTPFAPTTYTLVRSNGVCTSTSTVFVQVNPLPNLSATASPTQICAGDPVTLNAIGGITYTWSPGGFSSANFQLSPNSTTNYTVTASTGSCSANAVVQLSVNPSPVVGINSSTTSVCVGNSVVLTATGNALNYTWQPGSIPGNVITVSPTVPAIYTLTGTNAFNCSVQQTQLIIANPLPVLNLLSSVPFVCAGNPALLSIQNATETNVTYSWSNNPGPQITVSPTITTDYFAFGTNSVTGCNNTNTLTLSVFISTFAVTGPTAICKGSSATFSASGGATGYSWNVTGANNTPSITVSPIANTSYVVIGTTGSCSSTLTVPLIVNPLPGVSAFAAATRICRLEFGTLTAIGANTYTWDTGATTPSITFNNLTVTTTFTVTGTNLNGCSKTTTVTQFVSTCIGIDALNANSNAGLNIYPNPNNGNFSVSSDKDIKISIVNTLGQVILTTELLKDLKKDLAVSNLPNGIYFVTGEYNGVKVNKKIIIEK